MSAFPDFSTLAFDAITGPVIPALFFGGNFMALTVAQIPFTLYHLLGNVALAVALSPLIEKYVVANEAWELPAGSIPDTKTSAA